MLLRFQRIFTKIGCKLNDKITAGKKIYSMADSSPHAIFRHPRAGRERKAGHSELGGLSRILRCALRRDRVLPHDGR